MGTLSTFQPPLPPGHLFGLTLANNVGDATNDIDFAAGSARNSTNIQNLVAPAGMTKQLDAAWAAGNAAGGRMSAAAIANTTYHCFIIGKPDGTTDFGFDVSATAPTMPTGYTTFRRIGSIVRTGGAIKAFRQFGDIFKYGPSSVPTDRSSTAALAETAITLTVPLGIRVQPILRMQLAASAGNFANALRSQPNLDETIRVAQVVNTETSFFIGGGFFTDTSAQIQFSATIFSGAIVTNDLFTVGWIDDRGRLS